MVWACVSLVDAFGEFTIHDKAYRIGVLLAGLGLMLGSAVGCIFRKTRRASVVAIGIVVLVGVASVKIRGKRIRTGRAQLEAIYHQIAEKGPPFPDQIDRTGFDSPSYLHWYYQKNSDESFGIALVIHSDGYVLEYPNESWQFIGYNKESYDSPPRKSPPATD